MRPGVVLDPSGLPRVEAIRTHDGQLAFGYLTTRPGGMVVLADVPPEVFSSRGLGEGDSLGPQLRAAAEGLQRQLAEDALSPEVPQPGVTAPPPPGAEEAARALEEQAKAEAVAEAAERERNAAFDRVAMVEDDLSAKDVEIAELRARLEKAEASGEDAAKKPAAKPRRTRAAA